jgi:hypothetical protein
MIFRKNTQLNTDLLFHITKMFYPCLIRSIRVQKINLKLQIPNYYFYIQARAFSLFLQ